MKTFLVYPLIQFFAEGPQIAPMSPQIVKRGQSTENASENDDVGGDGQVGFDANWW